MSTYLEFLRVSFQTFLAYRARYIIGVITYLVHVGVYYFIYQALFTGEETINGYRLPEMVTYIAIGWISKSFYLNYIDHNLASNVRMGHIAMDLIKPVDFQLMYYFRGYGQSLFRVVLFTPPIVVATIILFPITPPASGSHMLLFLISTLFSAMVYLGLNFLFGILAVFFLSITGILYPKNLMIELFSGLLIPIDWFPGWFQAISSMLPFQTIAFVPLSIYLGRLDPAATARALSVQAGWAFILFLAGRLLWQSCQRKILVQGG
jgi:ABC-2 type transport system permease protein